MSLRELAVSMAVSEAAKAFSQREEALRMEIEALELRAMRANDEVDLQTRRSVGCKGGKKGHPDVRAAIDSEDMGMEGIDDLRGKVEMLLDEVEQALEKAVMSGHAF